MVDYNSVVEQAFMYAKAKDKDIADKQEVIGLIFLSFTVCYACVVVMTAFAHIKLFGWTVCIGTYLVAVYIWRYSINRLSSPFIRYKGDPDIYYFDGGYIATDDWEVKALHCSDKKYAVLDRSNIDEDTYVLRASTLYIELTYEEFEELTDTSKHNIDKKVPLILNTKDIEHRLITMKNLQFTKNGVIEQ